MLDKRSQTGKHTNVERGLDLYDTPPQALAALLAELPLSHMERIWEPAAGQGNLVYYLQELKYEVVASDIIDRGCVGCRYMDFLKTTTMPPRCKVILTNPPYRWAKDFVRHALQLKPKLLILLLRLAFLEGTRRTDILERSGLAHIFVFRNRLPMMHRAGWTGKKASSAMPFAWFVWKPGFDGVPTISRISWKKG